MCRLHDSHGRDARATTLSNVTRRHVDVSHQPLGALVKFLSHERERRLAHKRGGTHPHVSAEALAENEGLSGPAPWDGAGAAFDRNWALTVVRAALESVERDCPLTLTLSPRFMYQYCCSSAGRERERGNAIFNEFRTGA
jgi:hypothetical protein